MNTFLEKCLPYLQNPCVSYAWLHSHPFHWADDGPAMITSFQARVHWYLNVALILAYNGFVVIRSTQICLDESKSMGDKIYMALATLVYTIPVGYVFTTVTRRVEFVEFLRGYLNFLQRGELSI